MELYALETSLPGPAEAPAAGDHCSNRREMNSTFSTIFTMLFSISYSQSKWWCAREPIQIEATSDHCRDEHKCGMNDAEWKKLAKILYYKSVRVCLCWICLLLHNTHKEWFQSYENGEYSLNVWFDVRFDCDCSIHMNSIHDVIEKQKTQIPKPVMHSMLFAGWWVAKN